MTSTFTITVTVFLAIAAALSGGALFAFSNFVMRALGRVPAPEAIRVMQAINETAINPLFMLLLIGTGVAAIGVSGAQLFGGHAANNWVYAGTALYVPGVVLVTTFANVPLNNVLAAVVPDLGNAGTAWASYASPWTAWNHIRTVLSVAAAAAFLLAAR